MGERYCSILDCHHPTTHQLHFTNSNPAGKKLGEGTYANVFAGHLRTDPTVLVAIKKIKFQKDFTEGLPVDAIRELKCLQELSHPNIISLVSVYSSKDQLLNLVLEYLPLGDLEILIRDPNNIRYGAADIKAWMGMLTRAVTFCHDNFILHRDIKPNNLLIAANGEIKLADFGLARTFADPNRNMTYLVITRWYRPPELLFGARHYSGAVDIWSVGCVFAELIIRTPYIAGGTDVEQVSLICQAVGSPTEEVWPGVKKLRYYAIPEAITPVRGRDYYMQMFGTVGAEGVDLLMGMLALDPRKRITGRQALEHGWWAEEPRPTRTEDLPKKGGGEKKLGEDLKRTGALDDDNDRAGKVARRLDFSSMMR